MKFGTIKTVILGNTLHLTHLTNSIISISLTKQLFSQTQGLFSVEDGKYKTCERI